MKFRLFFVLMTLAAACGLSFCGQAMAQAPVEEATLVVDNSVEDLLAGDLLDTVTVDNVRTDLDSFPDDWPVVGVGSTDWPGRNGELMPGGTVGDLHFWWSDPNSMPSGQIRDLADSSARFPFVALAVGNPEFSMTWSLQDVDDVHSWLEEKFQESGVEMAGVQIQGEFGPVETSVVYNIPLTGLDLSAGYLGDDYFRFGHYLTATWTIHGLYTADPNMQPVISTPGHPLHLHGYQNSSMLGGHVKSARVISATATIWPLVGIDLDQVDFLEDPDTPVPDYAGALRRAVDAQLSDPAGYSDLQGLMMLGLLWDRLVEEHGQKQVDEWLDQALGDLCLTGVGAAE